MTAILDFDFTIELIAHALKKEQENTLWEMWLVQFSNMEKETFVSFEDYKKNLVKSENTTQISYDDIEKEMLMVINSHESKVI